ncbi:hypothetical protein VDG05_16835 [Xanthomonas campestris pv. raphani]|uniref:hypothetical protein n=1 Tax=Xanthomonas campestris TaxID=339 RepID=UPI002B22BFED|nr:hypothetical protein [Xanthomonas campestris]MEA9885975.1 hypothetical protein [Xanthomonas campestris pv. raphani]
MSTTYINPWYQKGRLDYGPDVYSTDAKPTEYRGYLVFQRNASCFDVVKDGVCVTQLAGANGARRAIDALLAAEIGVSFGVRNCGTCSKTYTCVACDHESHQQLFDLSCPEHSMRALHQGGVA